MAGHAQSLAGKAQTFFRGGLYIDLIHIDLKGLRNVFPHLFDVGCHLGSLCNDRRIDIDYTVSFFGNQVQNMRQ